MNLKSTTTNGFNFRIINSLMDLGGTLDLALLQYTIVEVLKVGKHQR